MKKLLFAFCLLFGTQAHSEPLQLPFSDENLIEGVFPVSEISSKVEMQVRNAAVRVLSIGQGHGSGSLIRYKGSNFVLTAKHVTGNEIGKLFLITHGNEAMPGVLIYADPVYDIAIVYPVSDLQNAKPIRYSPRKKQMNVGEEVTYSGFPSTHEIMTFRGRVAGYETTGDTGIQIIMHSYGWFGSSGSVVYDDNGDLVGILWGVDVEWQPNLQVVGDIIWVQPIQVLDLDNALVDFCQMTDLKMRVCR